MIWWCLFVFGGLLSWVGLVTWCVVLLWVFRFVLFICIVGFCLGLLRWCAWFGDCVEICRLIVMIFVFLFSFVFTII